MHAVIGKRYIPVPCVGKPDAQLSGQFTVVPDQPAAWFVSVNPRSKVLSWRRSFPVVPIIPVPGNFLNRRWALSMAELARNSSLETNAIRQKVGDLMFEVYTPAAMIWALPVEENLVLGLFYPIYMMPVCILYKTRKIRRGTAVRQRYNTYGFAACVKRAALCPY